MKELIRVRIKYASRQQCCKTQKRPLPLPYLSTYYCVIYWLLPWANIFPKIHCAQLIYFLLLPHTYSNKSAGFWNSIFEAPTTMLLNYIRPTRQFTVNIQRYVPYWTKCKPIHFIIYNFSTYSVIIFCVEHVLRSAQDYDFDTGSGYTKGSWTVQSLTYKLWLAGLRKDGGKREPWLQGQCLFYCTAGHDRHQFQVLGGENSWQEISVARRRKKFLYMK